jgi:hypothetical protein
MALLYTATASGLTLGFSRIYENKLTLGDTGRQRRRIDIPASIDRYADVGAVVKSGLNWRIEAGTEKNSAVVHVKTEAAYTRGAPGGITLGGQWVELVRGMHAWGDAGNLGAMPDVLVGIRAEQTGVCRITFSGGRNKGYGVRWLCATDRGADWPTVTMVDCHPSAHPALRPAAVLLPDELDEVREAMLAHQMSDDAREHVLAAMTPTAPQRY